MSTREQSPRTTSSAVSVASGPQDRRRVYIYGEWEIDCARRGLSVRGTAVPVGSRAFDIVEVLVQSPGELVTKDDLMARVWSNAIVEDNTLQVHISAIRKALGADRGMLKTVSGRGYRLLGTWTIQEASAHAAPHISSPSRVAAHPFRTNVPVAASALIGRETAVQELRDLLSAYRVVTLTGPGGIGKTVLAAEMARSLFPTLEGDVLLVELVSLSDPSLVPSAVASLLGLQLGGDVVSAESVARAIGSKRTLLVLDNCEHVIDEAAKLAETIVRLCPHTSILATSREVLRIEGEQVYRVSPLDVPPDEEQEPGDILKRGAVHLFVARASARDAHFSVAGDELRATATICRRLDGIPLAIEFAAARAAVLSCTQVASALDDRFSLLTSGRRTALPRHQTLQATLDWSYDLLPEPERRLLRHLAIFAGGFTREAAAAVMADTMTPLTVLEGIANLVAKSLVIIDGPEAAARWRLLETIRAYGLKKLAESGAASDAARRHAEFFQKSFPATDSGLSLGISGADMARYVLEIDNVRAALDWSFSSAGDPAVGISLAAAYAPAWLHLNLMSECRERSEKALDYLAPDSNLRAPLRMRLYLALGRTFTWTMGSIEKAKWAYEMALELAEGLDDVDEQLHSLWLLWGLQYSSDDWLKAKQTAARYDRVASRSDGRIWDFVGHRISSYMLHYNGRLSDARTEIEHLLDRSSALKEQSYSSWNLHDQYTLVRALFARTLWLQGFVDRAISQISTILEEAETSGYSVWLCDALRLAMCPVSIMTGNTALAERILKLLYERAAQFQAPYFVTCAQGYEGMLLIKRGDPRTGLELLGASLDRYERTGWTLHHSELLGGLAEGLMALGNEAEALSVADRAVTRAADGVGRWFLAELLRIKGEAYLKNGSSQPIEAAEKSLHDALNVAQEQGALFWELRIASSLARLWASQHRTAEAREILASVYDRFTEGFETADLVSARALLEALPSPRV